MPLKPGHARNPAALRRAAEARLKAHPAPPAQIAADAHKLQHELQVHQVELEMQNEELCRGNAALDAEREHYLKFYNLSPAGFFTLDEAGLIQEANRTAADLLGVAGNALLGQPFTRFIFKADQDVYYLFRQPPFTAHAALACELRMMKTDHPPFWVHLAMTPVPDEHGRTVCRIVLTDISEQRLAMETLRRSEERYELAEAAVNDGLWDWNLLTDEDYFSPRWKGIIGYQDSEVANTKAAFFELLHPEDLARVKEMTRAHLEERKPYALEFRLRHKDGSYRWLFSRGQAVRDAADRPVRMVGATTDITERKQAETKLAEANSLLAATLEATADGILVADSQGQVISFNQKFLHLWQMPASLAASRNDQQLLDYVRAQLTTPAQFMAKVEELYRTPEATSWDELKFRDGRVLERYSQPQRIGDRTVGRVWSFRDVSKRKRAEAELKQSEARWQFALEGAGDGVWDWNAETGEVIYSRQWKAMLGYAEKEIGNRLEEWEKRVHPEDLARCQAELASYFRGEIPAYVCEHRMCCKDGSYKWILDRGRIVERTSTGQPRRVIGTHQDINARKLAEVALRETEINYFGLFNTVKQAIYIQNADLTFITVNQGAVEMYGYDREYFIGKTPEFLSAPGKNDLNRVVELVGLAYQGQPQKYEFWGRRKDGTVFPKDVWTVKGKYFGQDVLITLATDITERKQAEAALEHERNLLRTLVDHLPDMIYARDQANRFLIANEAFARRMGTTAAGLIGRTDADFYPAEVAACFVATDRKILAGGALLNHECQVAFPNGEQLDIMSTKVPLKTSAGEVIGLVGVIHDITARKQAEAALRIAQFSLDCASDAVAWINPDASLQRVNEATCRLLGYSREQLMALSVFDFHPAQTPAVWTESWRRLREQKVLVMESICRRQDGQLISVEVTANWMEFEGREINCSFVRDITQRKQTEAALRDSEARFRATFEQAAVGMAEVGLDGRWLRVNQRLSELLGYTEAELVAKKFQDLTHPDDLSTDLNQLQKLVAGEIPNYSLEKRYYRKDGAIVFANITVGLVHDVAGEPKHFISVVEDITLRKQAETYDAMGREVLQILNMPEDLTTSIRHVVATLKTRTGFEAVGIRLKAGADFPYFIQHGFSEDFLLTENTLVERTADGGVCRDKDGNVNLECTCGLVLSGKTDPANPLFTPGGSFWTNDSSALLHIPPGADPRRHPRNRCIHDGYASVLLVPIRNHDRIMGLIQFNDRRKDRFSRQLVELVEGIAAQIGLALLRKQAEAALIKNQSLLTETEKLGHVGGWEIDIATQELTWSEAVYEIHEVDFTFQPTVERGVNFYTPASRPIIENAVQRAIKLGETFDVELELITAKGNLRSVHAIGHADLARGKVSGFFQDITASKRAQAALQESEERFTQLAVQSSTFTWEVDVNGLYTFLSPVVESVLGYRPEELVGRRHFYDLHPQAGREEFKEAALAAIARRETFKDFPNLAETKNGRHVWLSTNGLPLLNADGTLHGYQGSDTDITERKQAEAVLNFLAHTNTASAQEPFFNALARFLATSLDLDFVCIDRLDRDGLNAHTVAVWSDGRFEDNVSYALKDTPCGDVVGQTVCCFPAKVCERFPHDQVLKDLRAESYLGVTLWNHAGQPIGLIALIGQRPLANRTLAETTLKMVAARAASELERLEAEAALRETAAQLLQAQHIARLGSYVFDVKTGTWTSSEVLDEVFGLAKPGATHDLAEWLQIIHPEEAADMQRYLTEEVLTGRTPFDRAYRIIRANDQKERWVHGLGQVMFDAHGQPAQMVGVIQDITERKRVTDALRENEHFLRESQKAAQIGSYITDLKTRTWKASPEIHELFGIDESYPHTLDSWAEIVHPDCRAELWAYHLKVEAEKQRFDHEYRIRRVADGAERWVHGLGELEYNAQGKAVRLIGTIQDITKRKQAETLLRQTEAKQSKMVANIGDVIVIIDQDGLNRFKSPNVEKWFGWRAEELVGISALANIHLEDRAATEEFMHSLLREPNATGTTQCRYCCKDGSYKWIEFTGVNLLHDPDIRGLLGNYQDISQRKRAEVQMNLQTSALTAAANAIVITGPDGKIEWVNPSFTRLTGYTAEEAMGSNPRVLKSGQHPPAFYATLWTTISTGNIWHGEVINKHKDGHFYTEEMTITPVREAAGQISHFVAIKQDITERRQLENQLRQSQKMEGIGQLAGGVAHDFNNILASLIMQIELIDMVESLPLEAAEGLKQIRADANRAASLTRQLLLFSRRQVMQPQHLDLNEVVLNLGKMLQRIIGEDVHLQFNLHPLPLMTQADAGMIDQVLLNLAVNARDAMPKGGRLRIETMAQAVQENPAGLYPDAPPGNYVCLSVSDTGSGIPPAILPKIFEPFFTTKEAGKGTGLGLATVFGIVKQHHGWIKLDNRPGQGVTFQIFLPASTVTATETAPAAAKAKTRWGRETILLVEDEARVRLAFRKILERSGYQVIEAANGIDAINLWPAHRGTVALLLTDLVMPGGLTGQELASQLQAEQPGLKVIYMSGYSAEIAGKELRLGWGEKFIQKPFDHDQLLETIRQSLKG